MLFIFIPDKSNLSTPWNDNDHQRQEARGPSVTEEQYYQVNIFMY